MLRKNQICFDASGLIRGRLSCFVVDQQWRRSGLDVCVGARLSFAAKLDHLPSALCPVLSCLIACYLYLFTIGIPLYRGSLKDPFIDHLEVA